MSHTQIVDDLPDSSDSWELEHFQRNALVRGLAGASPCVAAVCCSSALQCVALCCNRVSQGVEYGMVLFVVLQVCVAVCCSSLLQCIVLCSNSVSHGVDFGMVVFVALQVCVAVYSNSVLHCVAIGCRRVLQCSVLQCNVLQCNVLQCSVLRQCVAVYYASV